MSLELDPPELGFARPFTHEVINHLNLRNPHPEPIAFKVKTTAPKQYCVRPNSGRVEPGEQVSVQVILQAMKEDPPLDARCRDKFLVQSAPVPPAQNSVPINSIWQWVETNDKSSIAEKKIRVNFLSSGDHLGTPQRNQVNGVHTPMSQPPPPYQQSEAFNTPHSGHPPASGPATQLSSRPHDAKDIHEIKHEAYNPATDSSIPGAAAASAAAASVSNAVPKSREELQQMYEGAQAEIKRLLSLGESGMRQRKGAGGVDGGVGEGSGQQQQQQGGGAMAMMGVGTGSGNGVPVQITAALCLLSFLIAYLFF